MCNENKTCSGENKCIAEILNVINILQNNAECSDTCLDTCDRGFLGSSTTSINCNTRPVMLYTCCGNGTAWSMPVDKTDGTITSNVFRVEKIDGCCATFRVLTNNTEDGTYPYVATNTFFTMNLNCCCCLRCLADTYIECI